MSAGKSQGSECPLLPLRWKSIIVVWRGTAVKFSALCKQPSVRDLPEVAAVQAVCGAAVSQWLKHCNFYVNSWEIAAAATGPLQWNNPSWVKFD